MSSKSATIRRMDEINKTSIEKGKGKKINWVRVPDCLRPTKESIRKSGMQIDDYNKTGQHRSRYSERTDRDEYSL